MKHGTYDLHSCPVCGSAGASVEMSSRPRGEDLNFDALRPGWVHDFKQRVFFSYARCKGCGLLFAPVFFSRAQLRELYADMPANMGVVTPRALEATQRGYWRTARRSGKLDGGYLEIGPDTGYIVRHAARDGRFDHFWLFEPNRAVHPELIDACGDRAHTISTEMEDLSRVPDGSVGLAVVVHVLDHLLDPIHLLRQIGAKLMPDGVLLVVTHNEASVLRRLMRTKFPAFCLQHPVLYNPRSIAAVLERAGFTRSQVERSVNYFPLGFLTRQAAALVSLDLDRVPLPQFLVGLKLGNIVAIARNDHSSQDDAIAAPVRHQTSQD